MSNAGRIVSVRLTLDASTGFIIPFSIPTLGANAFYIVNSPFPLIIRPSVSQQSKYQAQTGEAFGTEMQSLEIVSQPTPLPISGSNLGFDVYIWVGEMSWQGIIDHRMMPAVVSSEFICAMSMVGSAGITIVTGLINIPAGTAGGKVVATPVPEGFPPTVNSPPFFNIAGISFSNRSLSVPVDLVEASGVPVMTLFPQQTVRISYPALDSSLTVKVKTNATMYFTNAGASAVQLAIGAWITTNDNFNF